MLLFSTCCKKKNENKSWRWIKPYIRMYGTSHWECGGEQTLFFLALSSCEWLSETNDAICRQPSSRSLQVLYIGSCVARKWVLLNVFLVSSFPPPVANQNLPKQLICVTLLIQFLSLTWLLLEIICKDVFCKEILKCFLSFMYTEDQLN